MIRAQTRNSGGNGYVPSQSVAASSATTSANIALGSYIKLTLSANTTLSFTPLPSSGIWTGVLDITQATPGNYTIAVPSGTITEDGGQPAVSPVTGDKTRFFYIIDGDAGTVELQAGAIAPSAIP